MKRSFPIKQNYVFCTAALLLFVSLYPSIMLLYVSVGGLADNPINSEAAVLADVALVVALAAIFCTLIAIVYVRVRTAAISLIALHLCFLAACMAFLLLR